MQKITVEVKDSYFENVLEMLHSVQGIMIEKIKTSSDTTRETELELMKLQTASMQSVWDNEEDNSLHSTVKS